MKSILAHISVIALAAVLSENLCADLSVTIPPECRLSEEVIRSVLRGNGKTEHQIELSKQYLDYDVNPTAMKRFLSQEQAQLRRVNFPIRSQPADQNFVEQKVYRARIDGSSEDGLLRDTTLMLGNEDRYIVIRIQTTDGSADDHDSFVSKIRIGQDENQEAESDLGE